ncbi:MAG: ATP synthase F1 subunit gamma [Oscillospiraceae bacterium]|jgi:ATP synthase F1, gamma subunit|nr:ATP synthase F1 subunit gamma [Oscillospiraceae bacterium]
MKDIKRRIKSVESTMQITKAMELVASSKLRKAKEKADKARPYFDALYETMCEIQAENPSFLSPFTRKVGEGKSLLVVIAGDRGLAGGFNSNIFKLAQARIDELGGKDKTDIIAIGKKAVEYFGKREFNMLGSYPDFSENIRIHQANDIAGEIVDKYVKGIYERVELFYTEYVSSITQQAVTKKMLPVELDGQKKVSKALPIYEPSAGQVFNHIVPRYVTGMIFGACVESFASEQASRRNAMENASDNASEMISSLSLMYNRARQASITQEITEIVGGANSAE